MKLDNFKCTECGKDKCELQVHHIKPLREIIKDHLELHDISIFDLDLGSEECLLILKEIKEYHFNNFNIGVTVCPDCHSKLDNYYKERKN